jgi:hypothetical protein
MAGVNIPNVGLAYTRYLQGVVETLNMVSKARTLTKQDDNWTGDHIEGRVHVRPSGALGATEDGGAFSVPNKQTYVPFKAYRKFIQGSIQLTDGVMAAASGTQNVAKDVTTSEVKGLMKEILKFENLMFFRDGTGSVAQLVNDETGSTDLEVTDARGLWEGVTYDLYDSTDGDLIEDNPASTSHGTCTIDSVEQALTSGNYRVNLTASIPAAAEQYDHLVWKGSLNRCPTGLDALVDDSLTGTFQGVTTGTYPKYTALVMDNSGTNRDLTPTLFRQMLAGLMQKSGNDRPSSGLTVLCNSWQAINVEELYEGELRLTSDSKTGGLAVSSFQSALGKIDIVVDVDCLHNKMFFVDFSKIYRAVQQPLKWRKQGGQIFQRSDVAGVWTATALEIMDYYIKERHTCGKIEDLSQSPVISF